MDRPFLSSDKRAGAPDAVYWERFDRLLKQSHSETCLRRLLQAVQRRLGTPAEQRHDLRRAREIAHRLDNLLTALQLRAHLQGLLDKERLPPAAPHT
jgi:hypothetical protein